MVEYYHAPCPLAAFTLFYVRCATHTHTHPFNGPFSGTAQVSWYPKGNTNLDLNEARDSEWQRHQLGHIASLHLAPDNHASTTPLSFLHSGCHYCRPTNSVKALKERSNEGNLC